MTPSRTRWFRAFLPGLLLLRAPSPLVRAGADRGLWGTSAAFKELNRISSARTEDGRFVPLDDWTRWRKESSPAIRPRPDWGSTPGARAS